MGKTTAECLGTKSLELERSCTNYGHHDSHKKSMLLYNIVYSEIFFASSISIIEANLSIMCETLLYDPFPELFWYSKHTFVNTKSFTNRKTTMLKRNTPFNMNRTHSMINAGHVVNSKTIEECFYKPFALSFYL